MNAPVRRSRPPKRPASRNRTRVLSPRFYTTDFAEVDRTDVSLVRERMGHADGRDALRSQQAPLQAQRGIRRRNSTYEPELDKEFRDFLISSITAEFSGCVLYAEMKKRAKNKDMKELFTYMSRDEARHAGFINDIAAGISASASTSASSPGSRNTPTSGRSSSSTPPICPRRSAMPATSRSTVCSSSIPSGASIRSSSGSRNGATTSSGTARLSRC